MGADAIRKECDVMIPKSIKMNIDTGEKTWLTPKYIIDSLGTFDLDPCCPPYMPWCTAKRMICRPDDGLEVDWNNQRVWLNPPYGRESVPFIKKMAANQNGIAFLFGRTDTKAWHNYIFPYAYGILFLRGRIRFCHMDGTESQTAPAPSVLVGYSEYDLQTLRDCELDGFLIQLKTNN